MDDIRKKFNKIYRDIYRSIDVSDIPEKYLNTTKLYTRFYPILKDIKRKSISQCVDFGCGIGAATVLGKLMGLDIVGIDIPSYSDGSANPYHMVHKALIDQGYNISIFDTSKYPWMFRDEQFDCMLSYCSMGKNSLIKDRGKNFNQSEWVNNRFLELIRISKDKSLWYLSPKSAIVFTKNNNIFCEKEKHIKIQGWPK